MVCSINVNTFSIEVDWYLIEWTSILIPQINCFLPCESYEFSRRAFEAMQAPGSARASLPGAGQAPIVRWSKPPGRRCSSRERRVKLQPNTCVKQWKRAL